MFSSARDDKLFTLSHLWVPIAFAFLFTLAAFGALFGPSYGLQLLNCPVVFLSNLAANFLGRSLFAYFTTIAVVLYALSICIHYMDMKLRLKWDIPECDIGKYICINKVTLLCGIISMLGFIGIASFPFTGMPVVHSLYFPNNTTQSAAYINSTVNIIHMIHVAFGYLGFFFYAWFVLILNVRTRCSYSASCRSCFLFFQSFLVILLTTFGSFTIIAMILMSVFYVMQPWTISNASPECWIENSLGYYSHISAIISQYISTSCIFLFPLTLIPPLVNKLLSISLEELTSRSTDTQLPPENETFSPRIINGEINQITATRRDRLSESSDVLFGNSNIGSQSDSLFDLYKETKL